MAIKQVQGTTASSACAVGNSGMSPTPNLAERRNGAVCYRTLAREYRRWATAADRLQDYMRSDLCSIRCMLSIVRDGRLRSYPGVCNYANVRLVRSISMAADAMAMGSSACWSSLPSMSPHVRGIVRRWALDHEGAVRLCALIRSHLALPRYGLSDRICFMCLAAAD